MEWEEKKMKKNYLIRIVLVSCVPGTCSHDVIPGEKTAKKE